ncbi:MAG: DUF4890 domain-containing protein [Alistipes sp.]
MKKRLFIVLSAAMLFIGMGVMAQEVKKNDQSTERITAEQIAQKRTDRMTKELSLTEAQRTQVYAVALQQAQKMVQHRAKAEAMGTQRAEKVKVAKEAYGLQMQKILTPEQYKKWQEIRVRHEMRNGAGTGAKECAMRQAKCRKVRK